MTDFSNSTNDENNRISFDKIKERLKECDEMINYSALELDYINKPIGKAIYNRNSEIEHKTKKKWNPSEKVQCRLCGVWYSKANKTHHKRSKKHQLYKKVNDRFTELILK
jgi:hypothetical protein